LTVSLYFARPSDTAIAATDPVFIESLEHTARSLPGVRVEPRPERADIILVDERYQYRTWRYADELARSDFVRRHAERICVINHDDFSRPFLPGLYTSLEKSRPALVEISAIPYKRDLWRVPLPDSFEFRPESLFAFRGAFHTHPVRSRLCRVLLRKGSGTCEELRRAFHAHDERDQLRYIAEIRGARFSLCPRGLSPSTYRLYESMQLGRCPVVIADDWLAPAGPDWSEFTIFVRESQIRGLPEILAGQSARAERLGRTARAAWEAFFSWPRRYAYFLERVVAWKETGVASRGFDELNDIWRGREIRRLYGWTVPGRAQQLARRKLGPLLRW
jgi:hypothetical protein